MKNLFYLLLLATTLFIACKDEDEDPNGLIGEWEWVQSYGGILGQTLTPASEGVTKHLEIDDDTYKEFVNDSLIFQAGYVIESRQDSVFGTDKVITFDTGYELAFIQGGDNLQLIELCFDCFDHSYVRQ